MPLAPKQEHETKREKDQGVFDGWLNECREIEDTVVELLLQNLPSLKEGWAAGDPGPRAARFT